MGMTQKIRGALALANKTQKDFAEFSGISVQSMSNKANRETWTARDLATVAELTGSKLAFIFPDGQLITIDKEDN